jgi:hypothetical protein
LCLGASSLVSTGQESKTENYSFVGEAKFERLVDEMWPHRDEPIGDLVGRIALELVDTPYVGFTAEISDDTEMCVVNMHGLDCVTLFENSLGIARMLKQGEREPEDLVEQVSLTRYRDGQVNGYLSRLHYTTDWFHDNVRKGVVEMVTDNLEDREPYTRPVGFMSANPNLYRQLDANPDLVPLVVQMENKVNARPKFYIPQEKVAANEQYFKTGDLVGITTTRGGIDITHTGLIYVDEDGVARFLHASSVADKVILDSSISEYLARVEGSTGVMIARPLEP